MKRAFTLIELLVVVAIIAVIATIVILVLNPAELLKQARDANRLSDIDTIGHALSIYASGLALPSFGSVDIGYLSVPDKSATSTQGDQCQGLGLPALASGDSYHCAATSTYALVDSTGWVPINFNLVSTGSPLGTLPQDPTNQTSSGLFYSYSTDGSRYELTANMESQKYQSYSINDGGTYSNLYEYGTSLAIAPADLAAVAPTSRMAFRQISSVSTGATVALNNTASGSFLLATILSTGNNVTNVSDGHNTWNFIGEDGSINKIFFFYTINDTSGNLTFTENGNGTLRFWVAEFTGEAITGTIATWYPTGAINASNPTIGPASQPDTNLLSIVSLWENPNGTGASSIFDGGAGTIVLHGGNGATFFAYNNTLLGGPATYTTSWTQSSVSANGGLILVKSAESVAAQ